MKNTTFLTLGSIFVALLLDKAYCRTYGSGCSNMTDKWKDLGGDFCYLVERIHTANFIDAVHSCSIAGGKLASFHSYEEVYRVVGHINRKRLRYYIGLWKHYDGSLEWVDKSPVDFIYWKAGEPNSDLEKCVEIYYHSGKWNDVDCSSELGYICSSPKLQPPSGPRMVCPYNSLNWSDFGGDACYIIETENKAKWGDALNRCTEEGGSLASFHSIEEISDVVQHTKAYDEMLYIGLRQTSFGRYEWSDDSPLDLDYWQSGEIGNAVQVCGEMSTQTGLWHKGSCKRISGYVCSAAKAVCGGTIYSDHGMLYSPHFPVHYGANEDCTWNITVPEDQQVALEFQTLDMEYGRNCQYDFVEVLDVHGSGSSVLGRFCGSTVPSIIRSSNNEMAIRFVTDSSNDGLGFAAKFTKAEICGGDFFDDKGYIESPNTPDKYGPGEKCVWKITVPEGKKVYIRFFTFEVEYSLGCRKDFVEIRDGHETTSTVLGRFCGDDLPAITQSSGNKMTVTFESDLSEEQYGFVAQFEEVTA